MLIRGTGTKLNNHTFDYHLSISNFKYYHGNTTIDMYYVIVLINTLEHLS